MIAVVPSVVQVHRIAGIIVPVAQHGVAYYLDQHRPAGIYLRLVLGKGEPQRVAIVAIDKLGVVLKVAAAVIHIVAAGLHKQPYAMCAVTLWRISAFTE